MSICVLQPTRGRPSGDGAAPAAQASAGPGGRARIGWQLIAAATLVGPAALQAAEQDPRLPLNVIAERCLECHDGRKPEGGLDLTSQVTGEGGRRTWRRIRDRVANGEMPPPEEPPIAAADRERLLRWIDARLAAGDTGPRDPGPPLIRRLSRDEYGRTLRDLVGLDFDAAAVAGIPDDSQGHGFANRADVLGLSPALMEKYFSAAEAVVDRVLAATPHAAVPPPAAPPPAVTGLVAQYRCSGPKADDNQIRATLQLVNRGTAAVPLGEISVRYWFTAEGIDEFQQWCDYAAVEASTITLAVKQLDEPVAGADHFIEVGFKAGVLQPGQATGDIQLRVAAGDWSGFDQSDDHSFAADVTTLADAPRITLQRGGKTVWGVEPSGPPAKRGPATPPPGPDATRAWERLFVARPGPGVAPADAARRVLEGFAGRAWRRPATAAELQRLMAIWRRAGVEGAAFEAAMRPALTAILVSPHFLLRVERDVPATPDRPYRRVDDQELAVRLAYFIWSSMPDDELVNLARRRRLSAPDELDRQVRRMLADARAAALTTSFGAAWLQFGKLATARPTPEFFPDFTPELRQAMLTEATMFFDTLRTEDRSLLDLVDADYTFVDEQLARLYGLPGVSGAAFRRVQLRPGDHRGGVLGMGAVLAATSHTFRTSPTLRGKYVLDVLLGEPPPPPPANASVLAGERHDAPTATFRESLARHSRDPACAACHSRIDPLGFGLEAYDGIGRWRDTAASGIDASGNLPGGVAFTGPEQLKAALGARRPQILRNASAQMLSFALGRAVEECDEASIDAITRAVEEEDGRFSTLVLEVARSFPFQHRRNVPLAADIERPDADSLPETRP
jgi:hypothetical protein